MRSIRFWGIFYTAMQNAWFRVPTANKIWTFINPSTRGFPAVPSATTHFIVEIFTRYVCVLEIRILTTIRMFT